MCLMVGCCCVVCRVTVQPITEQLTIKHIQSKTDRVIGLCACSGVVGCCWCCSCWYWLGCSCAIATMPPTQPMPAEQQQLPTTRKRRALLFLLLAPWRSPRLGTKVHGVRTTGQKTVNPHCTPTQEGYSEPLMQLSLGGHGGPVCTLL